MKWIEINYLDKPDFALSNMIFLLQKALKSRFETVKIQGIPYLGV